MEHSLSKGLLAAHLIVNSDFILSHLPFGSFPSRLAFQHFYKVIYIFEAAFVLSINLSKSELLGINLDASIIDSLASFFWVQALSLAYPWIAFRWKFYVECFLDSHY